MVVRSPSKTEKPPLGMPVIIAAIVILVLVLAGLAWHFFGPVTAPAGTGKLTADQLWMEQKAKQTGGDFYKLSPEDQRRLISIDGPKAPFDFRQAGRTIRVGP